MVIIFRKASRMEVKNWTEKTIIKVSVYQMKKPSKLNPKVTLSSSLPQMTIAKVPPRMMSSKRMKKNTKTTRETTRKNLASRATTTTTTSMRVVNQRVVESPEAMTEPSSHACPPKTSQKKTIQLSISRLTTNLTILVMMFKPTNRLYHPSNYSMQILNKMKK